MEPYKLDASLDANKVFVVKRSELENRFDPNPYSKDRIEAIKSLSKNNQLIKLKDVVKGNKSVAKNINTDDIYIGLENIISDTGEYIETGEKESVSSANTFKKGQILFPKLRPYLNKVYYTEFAGLCSTEFHVFESKTPDFETEFLAIYLRLSLIVNQTKHLMTGNTLPRLQTLDIENLPIPKIDKETQQQIVEIYNHAYTQKQAKEAEAKDLLDSIDTYLLNELGITLPEKDNSLEARIFTTKFSEVVGGRFDPFNCLPYFKETLQSISNGKFESTKLKKIISFLESGSRPSGGVNNIEEGVLSLGGEHVNSNCEIEIKNPKYIPLEFHSKILSTETKLLDILLVKDGATTGKVGIIEDVKFEGQNINEHVFLIRTKKNINPNYIVYILYSSIGQIQISNGITGATVTGITKDVVRKLQIPLPPLGKQDEIAAHIAGIRIQAKALQQEAEEILASAKQQVEQMILG